MKRTKGRILQLNTLQAWRNLCLLLSVGMKQVKNTMRTLKIVNLWYELWKKIKELKVEDWDWHWASWCFPPNKFKKWSWPTKAEFLVELCLKKHWISEMLQTCELLLFLPSYSPLPICSGWVQPWKENGFVPESPCFLWWVFLRHGMGELSVI